MDRSSEDDLIARYFAPWASLEGLGLKDDAALLEPTSGCELVFTLDALVAGIHFFPEDPPASIARKALGVNISDLAAKGARPRGFLLGLMLPADWTDDWLSDFARGLGEAAKNWCCPLLGGDTVRTTGPLSLSITALGEVKTGTMVKRSGAKPGDIVCVSGTIGDSVLGLELLKHPEGQLQTTLSDAQRLFLIDRYRHPVPRLALATALQTYASAAMDVSDGLAGDLAKLMRASGLSARVDAAHVPLSDAARTALHQGFAWFDRLVVGGDDYEILCTIPPTQLQAFQAMAEKAQIAVTPIGYVTAGDELPVFFQRGEERRYPAGSFSHFT